MSIRKIWDNCQYAKKKRWVELHKIFQFSCYVLFVCNVYTCCFYKCVMIQFFSLPTYIQCTLECTCNFLCLFSLLQYSLLRYMCIKIKRYMLKHSNCYRIKLLENKIKLSRVWLLLFRFVIFLLSSCLYSLFYWPSSLRVCNFMFKCDFKVQPKNVYVLFYLGQYASFQNKHSSNNFTLLLLSFNGNFKSKTYLFHVFGWSIRILPSNFLFDVSCKFSSGSCKFGRVI